MGTTTTKSVVVANGHSKSNSGFRQVVVSPAGVVRDVQSAVRSGYVPDRCTNQVAREGDYIIRVDWYPEQWSVHRVSGGQVIDLGHQGLLCHQALIRGLSKALEAFLQPGGRAASFLPAGCGWDGINTVADHRKKERLDAFLQGYGIDPEWVATVIESAVRSPGQGLPTAWQFAAPLPAVLDAPRKTWDGSMVDIDTFTQWVLFYDDNSRQLITPPATSGEWGSNYAHSERGVYDSPAQPMPKGVVRAIKITRGAYVHDHHSRGVKWELFAR